MNEKREFQILYNAVTGMGSTLSLVDTLKSVVAHIADALDSAGCAIFLWDRDRDRIETLID